MGTKLTRHSLLCACLVAWATPAFCLNPIQQENLQTGDSSWQLATAAGHRVADDSNSQIKGYASATSVNKGSTITFYVTVNPTPQAYTIYVYRMGWYGGTGGRLMQTIALTASTPQPTCTTDAFTMTPGGTGLTQCAWSASYTLNVPTTWTSGVFLARLVNANNYENYMTFVVRDDDRTADLLYEQPVTTYEAYNTYPVNTSLYLTRGDAGDPSGSGAPAVVKVSFDRPYSGDGAGNLIGLHELDFVQWAEKTGYDLAYATSVDIATGPNLLRYKGVLSVGHDEYWSAAMRSRIEASRNLGVNLGFFGGNDMVWQIRFENANRVIVCYRDASTDPNPDPSLKTVEWRNLSPSRPEQTIVGVQYGRLITKPSSTVGDGDQDYVPVNTNHWVYDGIDLGTHAYIPIVNVGYETDHFYAASDPVSPFPPPSNRSFVLLSSSPILSSSVDPDVSAGLNPTTSLVQNSVIYQANSAAWVFAAGTVNWNNYLCVLGASCTASPVLQGMTKNILDRYASALRAPGAAAVSGSALISSAN